MATARLPEACLVSGEPRQQRRSLRRRDLGVRSPTRAGEGAFALPSHTGVYFQQENCTAQELEKRSCEGSLLFPLLGVPFSSLPLVVQDRPQLTSKCPLAPASTPAGLPARSPCSRALCGALLYCTATALSPDVRLPPWKARSLGRGRV